MNDQFGPDFILAVDNYDMTMTYCYSLMIDQSLLNILIDFDLFPRPAGVEIEFDAMDFAHFGFGPLRKKLWQWQLYKVLTWRNTLDTFRNYRGQSNDPQ